DLIAFYDQPDDPAQLPAYQQYFRSVQLIRETRRTTPGYIKRLLAPDTLFPQDARSSFAPEMWSAIQNRLASTRYDFVQLFGGIQIYEYRELIHTLPNLIVPYESFSLYLERQLAQERRWLKKLTLLAGLQITRQYESRMFAGYNGVVVLSAVDAQKLRELN